MEIAKELMRLKASGYAIGVEQAREQCDEALWELRQVQSKVERFWQGESGSAMFLALDDAIAELARISTQLHLLKADMERHTDRISSSWVE